MVQHHSSTRTLLEPALSDLEAAIEAPHVPGEMARWIATVRQALTTTLAIWEREIRPRHREAFARIRVEDLALQPRIEQLSKSDQALHDQLYEALRQATEVEQTLQQSDGQIEPSQPPDELVEQCTVMLIRFRKQERAIDTWFMEAFQRDRGVAD